MVVGISGSTGVVYGVRVLERLRELEEVETHLVATPIFLKIHPHALVM